MATKNGTFTSTTILWVSLRHESVCLYSRLSNDFYARDTRKKIRAAMRVKGNAGEHLCTNLPYGYQKDPADKKWIVDEKAAETVKRIFALCIAGKGPM